MEEIFGLRNVNKSIPVSETKQNFGSFNKVADRE